MSKYCTFSVYDGRRTCSCSVQRAVLDEGFTFIVLMCRSQLDKFSISYKHPIAETGILATIGSGKPKFALRTDMDALPIEARSTSCTD